MGEQNLKLKRKLVIQSFLPLFILIFIRYLDLQDDIIHMPLHP